MTAAEPRYVATNDIKIEFRTAKPADITAVDLWVSTDRGRNWELATATRSGNNTLRFFAPQNGRYDFYLVLHNDAGASGEAPTPGTSAVTSVIVDTVPPLLQVRDVAVETPETDTPTIIIQTSLIEEHLSDAGVRVFVQTGAGRWMDGGPARVEAGTIRWNPPTVESQFVEFRLVATDRAGNRAHSRLISVELPTMATPQELDQNTSEELADTTQVEPAKPVTIKPVAPIEQSTSTAAQTCAQEADQRAKLGRLRDLAARFLSSGQYALAAARLEDALQINPHDADLLVDLGSAKYRLEQYNDAQQRFQDALATSPDHAGALEGLALVAATKKRYPEAREHLLQLLRVTPGSGTTWLRYGDIEHRLGNTTAALDAWAQVLDLPTSNEQVRDKAQRRLDYFKTRRQHAQAKPTGP